MSEIYLVHVDHSGQYALSTYTNREAAHRYARDVEGMVIALPVETDYRAPQPGADPQAQP